MQNWQANPAGGYPGQPGQHGQPGYPGHPYPGQPGPQQGGAPVPQPGTGQGPSAHFSHEASKGFAKALTDFSFRTSIGPTVIKILYGVVILAACGSCLTSLYRVYYCLVEGYRAPDIGGAIVALVTAAVAPAVIIVIGRLQCEILAAVFRIADNLQELNDKTKRQP